MCTFIYTQILCIGILACSITQICSGAQEQTVRQAAVYQFLKDATARTSSSPERAKRSLGLIVRFQLGTLGAQRATQQQTEV